jgi:hypothetical protein
MSVLDAMMPSATGIDTSVGALAPGITDAGLGAAGAAGGMAGFAGMLGPLSMMSTGIGAAGAAIQGIMGFVGGQQQAKAAQLAARQASLTAGVNTQESLVQGATTEGRAATLAAASGGGLGGTTAGVLNQIAERGQFNARAAAYRGATQVENDEYMAKVDKDNAINSLISGFSGAAGQAVAGGLTQNFRQSLLQSKAYQSGDIEPLAISYLG